MSNNNKKDEEFKGSFFSDELNSGKENQDVAGIMQWAKKQMDQSTEKAIQNIGKAVDDGWERFKNLAERLENAEKRIEALEQNQLGVNNLNQGEPLY